jgi:hypothetical protein
VNTKGNKIGERWTAENTFTLICGSVHNATSFSVEVAPVGPRDVLLISQQRKKRASRTVDTIEGLVKVV